MADVKWIKIATGIFDNRKIKQIERMPDGDAIIVVWFKLLCLAGNCNKDGLIYLTEEIPYTEEMLATEFGMEQRLSVLKLALRTFQQFKMIEIIDSIFCIASWEKYQNIHGLEKIREQGRIRQARYKENKRLLEDNVNSNVTGNGEVTRGNGTDIDIELDIDKDNYIVSKDTIRCTDVQRVKDAWNTTGLSHVVKIVEGTNRYKLLKKRITDYGLEQVLAAIENVKKSKFLNGDNKNGWQASFDWFIKPNNFPKVLDGNYNERTGGNDSNTISGLEGWSNALQKLQGLSNEDDALEDEEVGDDW